MDQAKNFFLMRKPSTLLPFYLLVTSIVLVVKPVFYFSRGSFLFLNFCPFSIKLVKVSFIPRVILKLETIGNPSISNPPPLV